MTILSIVLFLALVFAGLLAEFYHWKYKENRKIAKAFQTVARKYKEVANELTLDNDVKEIMKRRL